MKAAAATKAKEAGNRRFHSGDFAEAQALYSLGIEYDDAIPAQLLAQLYLNRSATHLKLQQLDAAEADAKCAAVLAPLWGKPHLRLAEVYHAKCTYEKAVDELEIALGVGAAAQDHAVVSDARAKMDEYRLLKDAEVRDESQNLAYSSTYTTEGAYKETIQASAGLRDDQDPSELLDKILKMKVRDGPGLDRHVLLGHQALRDGRYQDAVREFLAAAVNGNAEGMYYYAVMVEAGRGVKKNVGEAVQWLERAAQVPVRDEGPPNRNQGIGEAMSALARHHQLGIYFPMNSAKAVELWQRAATLGSVAALNALGVLYAHGGSGRVPQDLALARDYLRQAAEKFSNEAMLNLADLHASLQEFDVAIRWADSAVRFGFAPAKEAVLKYRQLAAMRPAIAAADPTILECLEETSSIARTALPTVFRDREAPAVEDLRAIRTPYVRRLCLAKETMVDALSYFEDDEFVMSAAYAVEAHRIPDSHLVFSPKENMLSHLVAQAMLENDVPQDAGLALLLQPPDPAAVVCFYGALHQQFPEDYTLAIRAACAHMFEDLAGSSLQTALQLFDHAYTLLLRPDDDADPLTLDYLSMAGPVHMHADNLPKAKSLLTRFVAAGTRDGHRKAPEAHFHLGTVEIAIAMKDGKVQQRKALRIALDHLKAGRTLAKTLPLFLQPSEPPCPERTLANFVRMWSHALDVPIDLPNPGNDEPHQHQLEVVLRGGEVLNGPKRHAKLRRDRSRILDVLKKARVPIAKMMATNSGHMFKWTTAPPPKKPSKSQRKRSATASPATIDELFSALRDQVYEGRALECIVVAPPCWSGSSHAMLVEDSQREPAIVAVYNASPNVASQLVPGRVLRVANPYVRIAADQSILIRVDDPGTLRICDLHEICWNCGTVHGGTTTSDLSHLQSCAKCHRAKYCSRECQKEDWRVFGHRYLCK